VQEILLKVARGKAEVKIVVTNMSLHEVNNIGTYYNERGYTVTLKTNFRKVIEKKDERDSLYWIGISIAVASVIEGLCAIAILAGA